MTTTSRKHITHTRFNTWTVPQIMAEFGVSRGAIKRYVDEAKFPQPVEWNPNLGNKRYNHYDRTEVTALLDSYKPTAGEVVSQTIRLTKSQLELIRGAAKLVYLGPERYMVEVLMNNAKRIHNFANQVEDDTF